MKRKPVQKMNSVPESGYLRLSQIVGDIRKGLSPIIPISKSSWWSGVKSGKYPQPIKRGSRTTVWRTEDVLAIGK
jgi:hypothetical protein